MPWHLCPNPNPVRNTHHNLQTQQEEITGNDRNAKQQFFLLVAKNGLKIKLL